MLITTDGLITRSYPAGDHDRLVHLVTADHGRLAVLVKGGKSGTNRFAPITQLFTYGNYELYRKGEFYWLRGGSVNHSFYRLTEDITRMALGTYLCDITSELTDEGGEEGAEDMLHMLLNALYVLERGTHACAVVKGVFELRAAALSGYAPNLVACARCGNGYPENSYLDIMNGRMICADCQTELNRSGGARTGHFLSDSEAEERGERHIICPMTSSTLAAARYALAAPEKKIFSFTLTDREEEMTFERLAETYLLNHLERTFDTLDFYRSVRS